MPHSEAPARVPSQLDKHMLSVAHSIGALLEPPSCWYDPNPTVTAPLAAMMPHSAWPAANPPKIAIAIAGIHRCAARG